MDIIINETNSCAQLTYLRYGIDLTAELVSQSGALHHDFAWDDDACAWRCDTETYHYWLAIIAAFELLDARIESLCETNDRNDVLDVVADAANGISDIAAVLRAVHADLDLAFGAENN